MSFDTLGPGGLDYLPCRYGASKLLFRGPRRDLSEGFVAFLGGTQTYGKFIERPFPDLIEERLDTVCANFGCMNAGIDVLVGDPFLREAVVKSRVTVIQVLSPRNMSNRFYSVHPRRNDRFLKPSALLEAIYREVDFSEFNFTKHMLTRLNTVSPDRFRTVIDELQQAWMARMSMLLKQVPGKTVLLWFSYHAPGDTDEGFGFDPWFVTSDMLATLRPNVTEYVEVIASDAAREAGTDGMVYSEMEAPAAEHVLSPLAHREAADALLPILERLLK